MSFSKQVKEELLKIREFGKTRKDVLNYGLSYGVKDLRSAGSLIDDYILNGDGDIGGIFLRGVFLSCGSVSNPVKEYHLELALPNEEKCKEVLDFAQDFDLNLKQSSRRISSSSKAVETAKIKKPAKKQKHFLYLKNKEQISDFLVYIGASKSAMELMQIMINKEIRNNVNRRVNCESANLSKSVNAAVIQVKDIEYILEAEKKTGKRILSDQLREVAKLRRSNTGISLSELGDMLEIPISKSGVNHRLHKISDIAQKLRKNK